MPRAWAGVALLAAVIGGVIAWAFHTTTEVQVSTAAVTVGPIARRIFATGTVQPVTTVEVGTQVSGIVQALGADYNSSVHQGQVLAKLDPSSYDAQLRAAQAALTQARADLLGLDTEVADAQIKFTRAETLSASQLIPQSDLDAARIALEETNAGRREGEATVVEAAAAVTQASVNLEHMIIRSPIDGIVIERNVDVGQTLAASIQAPVLFIIAADLRQMQVQVDIDEADVGGLAPGEPATFEVESYPDEMFYGTVSQIRLQPIADQTISVAASPTSPATSATVPVVTYTAIVDVANPGARLRPGMTAEVNLDGSRREHAVRIPNNALAFRPSPDVLKALGEVEPPVADFATQESGKNGEPREVWEYDGTRLAPIAVRAGLADGGWTELLSGAIGPGTALVTSAVLHQHARM